MARVLREPFGDASGRREAGEVLQRLDPLRAIAEAEQRQTAK
jgi:hypothetical protein